MYKDTLGYQTNIIQKLKHNYGSMTEQEKKMNRWDLKSYKEGQHQVHSMIPGISNIQSVGTSPMLRKGVYQQSKSPLTNSLAGGQSLVELLNQSLGSGRLGTGQSLSKNSSTGSLTTAQRGLRYDEHPVKDSIHNKSKSFTSFDADDV